MTKKNNAIITKDIEYKDKKWEDALDKAFKEKNKEVEIKGFRKGKAPKEMYISKYGIESLYNNAVEVLIDEAYKEAFTEDINPIIQPKAEIIDVNENGVTFRFTFITKPELKIKKYKNLGVKKEEVKVSKKDIDEEIKHLLDHYADIVIKDGKIENGDTAIIDYEGLKDGEPFDGGTAEGYALEIGSNTFIPGFEEALIGLKKGDKKDVELTFPKDYQAKDLAGQKVVFKVKVNEVKTKEERKLDEDLFLDLDIEGVKDKASLEKHIKEELEKAKENEADNKFLNAIMEKISENAEVDLPEELIHEEAHQMLHQFMNQLYMQGIDPKMYFEITKQSEEDMIKTMEKDAEKNLKSRLIMDKIIEEEKIEVSDKELDKHVKERAKELDMTEEELINNAGGSKEFFRKEKEVMEALDKLKEYNK